MARTLASAGFGLSVYDVRGESMEPFEALGAEAAGSPAEAVAGADALFLMVVNAEQAEPNRCQVDVERLEAKRFGEVDGARSTLQDVERCPVMVALVPPKPWWDVTQPPQAQTGGQEGDSQ